MWYTQIGHLRRLLLVGLTEGLEGGGWTDLGNNESFSWIPANFPQTRGGGRARSLYATPPSPPPPPPPGFERWWAGDMAPTAPPFFPPGANGAPFSSVSARFRKTRRYTNVVCCPDMLTANVSPRTRGPWHGMLPPTM